MRRPGLRFGGIGVAIGCAMAAWLGPGASAAMDMGGPSQPVSIGFDSYAPSRLDVLAGDTVSWSNASVRAHTVSADDGSWSSERLQQDGMFSRRFDGPGTFTYYCRLHPFMRGEVDVHDLLLSAPAAPAAPGRPYPLHGRAALPADSTVSVEADTGAGFQPVGTATVGADGSFSLSVVPSGVTNYRAVAGGQVSPAVQLLVLDRTVTASSRSGRRGRSSVSVSVAPASPGATVVLQLHLRERFGWWPVGRLRLDRASRARFTLHLRRRVKARVALTLPDGATQLGLSPTFSLGRRG